MALSNANEQSTYPITVSFADENGDAVTPTSATWTLTDTRGNVVNGRDSVEISPLSTSATILLFGADLSLREDVHLGKTRVLTISGFYDSDLGDSLPLNMETEFTINDLVAVRYVDLTTPTLTAPADVATVTDYTPTFSWSAVDNAETYQFQLSTSSTFASITASQTSSATSYTASTLAGATYYWRVRAQASGLASDWTATRSFSIPTLSTPSLTSPSNAAILDTYYPTFTWGSVAGATGYTIDIATDSGFTTIVDTNSGASTSYTTDVDLAASTTHYWRVRATGAGEIVSSYSASRTFTAYVVYINTTTGSNLNSGLSAAAAVLDIATAQTVLTSLGGTGVIRIVAPESSPLARGINTAYTFTANETVTLESFTAGTKYYMTNALQYTSGWTQVDDTDIWIRTNSSGTGSWWCPTIPDAARDNLETEIVRSSPDTTTPAALEYSIVSTTTYINLGAGINPNNHQIERVRIASVISVPQNATVKLRDAVAKYTTNNTLVINDGILYATNCDFMYSGGSAVGTTANATLTDFTGCRAIRAVGNDGFNHNYGIMNLTNCQAKWNSDEGASPHVACTMNVFGGTYSYNDSPGFTAAESSIMNLYNVTVEYNGQSPSSGESTFGGISYGASSSGTCEGCTTRNNLFAGFYCATLGSVTVSSLTSTGNGASDVFC